MYTEFRHPKTGKVICSFGKKPVQQIPENVEEARRKIRAMMDRAHLQMSQPSSEEGKRLFYSRVSVIKTPFVIIADLWHLFMNNDVWYSPEGQRVVRNIRIV